MNGYLNNLLDDEKLKEASYIINNINHQKESIGTYFEKNMHAILKYAIETDATYHEIPYLGYIADIKTENKIYEIQTAGLYRLKNKIKTFSDEIHTVIVHPLPAKKWIIWVDPVTGEMTKKRRSPKVGSIFDSAREVYGVRKHLKHPNLEINIVFFDIDEYRNLDGWDKDKKRGSSRAERYPIKYICEYRLKTAEDYLVFLPDGLPETFTSADFSKAIRRNASTARLAINLLLIFDHITPIGKKGNAIIYKRTI